MKYYIIAGEASGDLHASKLVRELKKKDSHTQIRAWGGDLMIKEGAKVVKHINELAFMGFWEVLINLRTILHNIKFCKTDILKFKPDVIIFVDYPGFNLRIAKFAKQQNIKTVYYISPQVWAWNSKRVKAIKRDIDKMLVILPFEKDFYAKHHFNVDFVGHPLLDSIDTDTLDSSSVDFRKDHSLSDKPIIAILPGSRKQEISKMLGIMVDSINKFPDYQFIIAGVSAHSDSFYKDLCRHCDIKVVFGETYALLKHSVAAMVSSGTATLETAIIGTPQVVCYKAGAISYTIAKNLVNLKYISLVNLIMDQPIVKELIQHELTSQNLTKELEKLLHDHQYRKQMLNAYDELRKKLGGSGASENAADRILKTINSTV